MIEIIYADIANGAAEDADYSDTGRQSYSTLDGISDGVTPRLIATGEVGRWKLDGTVDILGYVDTDYGYVSSECSDASGNYTEDVGVDIQFNDNYASSGLTFTFDTTEDVFYKVEVTWYNDNKVVSSGVYDATESELIVENSVSFYNKIALRFLKSSKPYRFARLEHVVFGIGRRFSPYNFDQVNINQETNAISEELAIDTSTFVLLPVKNMNPIFQTRQTFRTYRDGKLISAHYLKSAEKQSKNKYNISCQSAIGILEEQPFQAVMLSSQTALQAAKLIIGDLPFVMAPELQNIRISGYIESGTRRSALHQLLFAIGAVCSTAETEDIYISSLPNETKTIPRDKIYMGTSVKRNPVVTSVSIEYHSYSTTETSGATKIEVGDKVYYDTVGVVEKKNEDIIANTPENPKNIKGCTLVTKKLADNLIDKIYDYHVNNTEMKQKILTTDEKPSDKVTTVDEELNAFSGNIVKRETVLTNLFASTLTIRGAYGED